MALLNDFLAGLNFPPTTLLKHYLENGIPVDLQSSTQCAPTDWCLKSSSKSSENRIRGNRAYHLKAYSDAREYYSQSIATAPTDSEELALAYGNRSAVHQVHTFYDFSLLDTNRALDGPLPQSSRTELLERKTTCWKNLQKQNVMRTKLRAGLSNLKCGRQERHNLIACERQLCYIRKVDIDDTDLVTDRSQIDDPEFETTFENEISRNLSPKIQRRVDEEWGQAFIAADDIEPGEILSNDELYALVVKGCNQYKYCSYCSVWCLALIPCTSCSQDMYCCVGCREKAYDAYHETECKMLPLWGNLSITVAQARRLVLRIFLTGTKQGSNLTTLLNDPRVYAALNGNLDHGNAQYSSTDYLPILNTFWKLDDMRDAAKQRPIIKEILEIFTSLRYVRFFGAEREMKTQCSGNTLTGEELMAIVLLVHNFLSGITLCHDMATYFWESKREGPLKLRQHQIGTAVGPWYTLVSQSCNPNATKVTSGRRVLCRSLRPIKAGEQIFWSGSMCYASKKLEDRQAYFKRFWGRECSCVACVENWPVFSELLKSRNRYLSSDRAVIRKIEKMQKWVFKKLLESIAEKDLKKVLEFCKTVHQYVNEPAYPMILCEDFLRQAMEARGNLYFSQKYIASLYNHL